MPLLSFRHSAPFLYLSPAEAALHCPLGWCSLLGAQTWTFTKEFAARICSAMKHHHLVLCLFLKYMQFYLFIYLFSEKGLKCYYLHKENSVYV